MKPQKQRLYPTTLAMRWNSKSTIFSLVFIIVADLLSASTRKRKCESSWKLSSPHWSFTTRTTTAKPSTMSPFQMAITMLVERFLVGSSYALLKAPSFLPSKCTMTLELFIRWSNLLLRILVLNIWSSGWMVELTSLMLSRLGQMGLSPISPVGCASLTTMIQANRCQAHRDKDEKSVTLQWRNSNTGFGTCKVKHETARQI